MLLGAIPLPTLGITLFLGTIPMETPTYVLIDNDQVIGGLTERFSPSPTYFVYSVRHQRPILPLYTLHFTCQVSSTTNYLLRIVYFLGQFGHGAVQCKQNASGAGRIFHRAARNFYWINDS